jgi:hypothetical protein
MQSNFAFCWMALLDPFSADQIMFSTMPDTGAAATVWEFY